MAGRKLEKAPYQIIEGTKRFIPHVEKQKGNSMEEREIAFPKDLQELYSREERPRRKVIIEIPLYSHQYGVWPVSETAYIVDVQIDKKEETVSITADKGGLISLARHLLTLAQDEVPPGSHIHYDSVNLLENGSCQLIVSKI